ncbi:MAG: NADH dehydrogenase [ubiquinone] 1 alpha subcomplex assembly factor 7 [Paracoccaceae bacterium]|jgi:NADH dehydrogenase [ubiquinone] 1 alpha subcomplex assembly factor 7
MTLLKPLIIQQIKHNGPITIAQYMEMCLMHPSYGYYKKNNPLGKLGDFITAPEISQMFGELIGLFFADYWHDNPSFEDAYIVELGPGRGTLMADIMRVTKNTKNFPKKIFFLESNEILQQIQRETLEGYDVSWINSITDLPDGPIIMVANEFFDALPINQYVKGKTGWHERLVGIRDDQLVFGLSEEKLINYLSEYPIGIDLNGIHETRNSAQPIIDFVSYKISQYGGVALIIDYGDWGSSGNTFQAVKNHKPMNPLQKPGECDLTAHVDFLALSKAANHCSVSALVPQGIFLNRLGIAERTNVLAKHMSKTELKSHLSGYQRLVHPTEMGDMFKALALFPKKSRTPGAFKN